MKMNASKTLQKKQVAPAVDVKKLYSSLFMVAF